MWYFPPAVPHKEYPKKQDLFFLQKILLTGKLPWWHQNLWLVVCTRQDVDELVGNYLCFLSNLRRKQQYSSSPGEKKISLFVELIGQVGAVFSHPFFLRTPHTWLVWLTKVPGQQRQPQDLEQSLRGWSSYSGCLGIVLLPRATGWGQLWALWPDLTSELFSVRLMLCVC